MYIRSLFLARKRLARSCFAVGLPPRFASCLFLNAVEKGGGGLVWDCRKGGGGLCVVWDCRKGRRRAVPDLGKGAFLPAEKEEVGCALSGKSALSTCFLFHSCAGSSSSDTVATKLWDCTRHSTNPFQPALDPCSLPERRSLRPRNHTCRPYVSSK